MKYVSLIRLRRILTRGDKHQIISVTVLTVFGGNSEVSRKVINNLPADASVDAFTLGWGLRKVFNPLFSPPRLCVNTRRVVRSRSVSAEGGVAQRPGGPCGEQKQNLNKIFLKTFCGFQSQ